MEYHSDRFLDSSLLFFESGALVAVMPANVADDIFYNHTGLTFGGIISDQKMKIALMLDLFDSLMEYLSQHRIKTIVYKPIPHIYHTV
ncbi:MAG: GNAT family N-acetyltransferase, partial [Halobacteriota archaeon]